jgi:hypothetical protein
VEGTYTANEQQHRIRTADSECQFVAADDPDSLRAGNVNWIWVDEPAIIKGVEAWRNIVGRARRGIPCVIFLTGTPKGYNWLHDEVWDKAAKVDMLAGNERPVVRKLEYQELKARETPGHPLYEDYWAIRVPSWLSGRVSQEDVDRAQEELSPDWFMQEYGADFRSFTGLVYQEFSYSCVVEVGPEPVQWWGAIDWGYHDPAAAILVGRSKRGVFVFDEYYRVRADADEQIAWALERQQRHDVVAWVADSARPDLIARARLAGLRVWAADRSPGTIAPGVEEVRRYLRAGRLFVHPRCRNLIREFQSYRYPDGSTRGAMEIPLDRDNHALDALRYLLWALRGLALPEDEPKKVQLPDALRSEPVEVSYWVW